MTVAEDRDDSREAATARELYRRKRGRNIAVLLAIFAACVLFYVITIVRMV